MTVGADTWVFGYGSLVSPASLASTIGRTVDPGHVVVAHLRGYSRRWNYGSLHLRGDWQHGGLSVEQGVVISLGLVSAADESCNGVAVRVTDDELARLDWRERDYERTDVTDLVVADPRSASTSTSTIAGGRVVTYVPRPSAVERYESARDGRRAAIRASYWELVTTAFRDLGHDHAAIFAATPEPDVPVVEMSLSLLG
jgi:cation transport regulator ChaC